MRDKTHAMRTMVDDVPEDVKKTRLQRMIDVFMSAQLERSQMDIGKVHLVLVDGVGKKPGQLKGKTDTYRTVVFDAPENTQFKTISGANNTNSGLIIPNYGESSSGISTGDYVLVQIIGCTSNTLFGKPLSKSTFSGFFELSKNLPFISANRLINSELDSFDAIQNAKIGFGTDKISLNQLSTAHFTL